MVSDQKLLQIYDISGIRLGRRHTQSQRRDLLCTIIQKNSGIRHNHILRLVEKLDAMAKKTAENELKNLENLVDVTKEGYNNKFYEMKLPTTEEEIKEDLQSFLSDIDENVKLLEKKYTKLSIYKGTQTIALLLHNLYSIYPMIVLSERILTHTAFKKQKIRFEKLIQRTHNITDKPNDLVFVFLLLASMIYEDKTEDELNSLLEEIESR